MWWRSSNLIFNRCNYYCPHHISTTSNSHRSGKSISTSRSNASGTSSSKSVSTPSAKQYQYHPPIISVNANRFTIVGTLTNNHHRLHLTATRQQSFPIGFHTHWSPPPVVVCVVSIVSMLLPPHHSQSSIIAAALYLYPYLSASLTTSTLAATDPSISSKLPN